MIRLLSTTVMLAVLVPRVILADEPAANDRAAVNTLVDQILKAHGGSAALGKVVAFRATIKSKMYLGNGNDESVFARDEASFQGDDKMISVITDAETKVKRTVVIDGSKGWTKDDNKPAEEMSDDEWKSQREVMYLNWITTVFPLKEKEFKLSILGETSVSDRPAIGLQVNHAKHEPVKIYFDKESHLMVMTEHTSKSAEGDGRNKNEVWFYSDYQTVQGIQVACKGSQYIDNVLTADIKILDLKCLDKPLDEKLFAKP